MTCILHFYGDSVDVNAFLRAFPLPVPYRTEGRNHSVDICFNLSTPEFERLHKQTDQAIAYLREHESALTAMCLFTGIKGGMLDFAVGVKRNSIFFDMRNRLPLALVKLAAKIGLAIEVSIYFSEDD